jgi:hypothetical protein
MRGVGAIVLAFVRLQVDDDVPRDITGPEAVPVDADPDGPWGWLVALALAVAVIAAVLWAVFRKPNSRPMKASERALRQLDRLQRLQLLAKNQGERHFTLLADILRRFVEKSYGIAAARLATRELLESAARTPALEGHLAFLREFLAASDIAKFAPPATIAAVGRDLDDRLRLWLTSHSINERAAQT